MKAISQPSDLTNARNRIVHKIRDYDPMSVIYSCIHVLQREDSTSAERMRHYQPWALLLLIKWALLHGELWNLRNARQITLQEFNDILDDIQGFPDLTNMPSEYENLFLYLRNVAYQQFWLQETYVMERFARQEMFFSGLSNSHSLTTRFNKEYGLTISEMLELCFVLMARFYKRYPAVSLKWFSSVAQSYGIEKIDRFLSQLSLSPQQAKSFLSNTGGKKYGDPQLEWYEQSPFLSFPLLNLDSVYYCYFDRLLFACVSNVIYDRLKSLDSSWFMNHFGQIFQDYLRKGLIYAKCEHETEAALSKVLGEESKKVDFVVVNNDKTLFIDAKGVEISYLGMVEKNPQIILGKVRDTIVKGIEQGFETSSKLLSGQVVGNIKIGHSDRYLLIVTYKEPYLSNGRVFYDAIGKDKLDKIVLEKYDGNFPIPLEHIYFISIDDFDFIVQYAHKNGGNISAVMMWAVEQDLAKATEKLHLRQHLQSMGFELERPKYLTDTMEKIIERIKEKIIDTDSISD